MATIVWSNPQARAVPTTWPSKVPSPYGSSCFGRPRRFEAPAPSTSPVTNGSARAGMLVRQLELGLTALATEVEGLALAPDRGRAGHRSDGHPADRVDGGRGPGGLAPAHGDDFREDRQRDLGGSASANVDAGGHVDTREKLGAHAVAAQLAQHA